ncbi:uncharacterized protein B0I36DRAFT_311671 [Microdochium trichocladiopsis]|uniref:Nephrocystin 3-like N-terminal domain-containing protein n=1 Tax=Microdochium trichocladiopsis TaxID=1682393 RepID=A0A9P9BWK0_9PEZI|nr:uncharacterized protein B0I36DRAFT_311671 [Microdochium trichocladiopsis]KAH7040872.1 hypothetical protein B0I36DRAFT_311671 [Microdochium trichocladiopsis]
MVLVSLDDSSMDYLGFTEATNLRLKIQSPLSTDDLHKRFLKLLRLLFTNKHAALEVFEKAYDDVRAQVDQAHIHMMQTELEVLIHAALAHARRQLKRHEDAELRDIMRRQQLLEAQAGLTWLEQDRTDLLGKLSTIPYRDHKDRIQARVPGTCRWFTDHPTFLRWRAGEGSPLLWVSALPGCGKSVLLKYLVDDFLNVPNSVICYFFFKDDSEVQKSAINALKCLLHQILIKRRDLLNKELLKKFAEDQQLSESFTGLWAAILEVTGAVHTGEVVFVLDALDECQSAERAILIRHLVGWNDNRSAPNRLKILISSRLYTDIDRGFYHVKAQIHLAGENDREIEQISKEIDLVITARLHDVAVPLQLDEPGRKILQQALSEIPQKTYLWVYLVLEELEKTLETDARALQEIVKTLPKRVEDVYEKMLSRIGHPHRVKKMFSILLAAAEPLNLLQLSQAWAIVPETKHYQKLNVLSEAQITSLVGAICGLLVIVVDKKVYFLHQTAREFLLSSTPAGRNSPNNNPSWKESIVLAEAQLGLTRTLLNYLRLPDIPARSARAAGQLSNPPDLAIYCAKNLLQHLQDTAPLLDLADLEQFELIWRDRMTVLEQLFPVFFPINSSHLILAAWVGSSHLVRVLLSEAHLQLDLEDPYVKRTALHWAIRSGHGHIALLLIDAGADFSGADLNRVTAFTAACESCQLEVVRKMLDSDSTLVDQTDDYGRTPLFNAIWAYGDFVADMFLEHGADPRLQLDTGIRLDESSPFHHLLTECLGWEELLDTLIARGADVNETDYEEYTAFDMAAMSGYIEAVPLLLRYGATISRHEGAQALACLLGQVDVLQSFLDEDVEALWKEGSDFCEPLLWLAARGGHIEAVRLLMTRGGEAYVAREIQHSDYKHGRPQIMQILKAEQARFLAGRANN